jgi:hypothetical protein
MLVLLEEIDYGAVYGFYGISDLIVSRRGGGAANFHNCGIAGIVGYQLYQFILMGYFSLVLFARRTCLEFFYPCRPRRIDALVFFGIVLTKQFCQNFSPLWGPFLQELYETVFYVLFLAAGLRGLKKVTIK